MNIADVEYEAAHARRRGNAHGLTEQQMRLVDLDPRWFTLVGGGERLGLTFECPCCRAVRLGVLFHHQGREAMEDAVIHARAPTTKHIWTITVASFENVSLTPSIDASTSGHWHGFITQGAIH